MIDAEILDKISKALTVHDNNLFAQAGSDHQERFEATVFIREVRKLIHLREKRGWRRVFK